MTNQQLAKERQEDFQGEAFLCFEFLLRFLTFFIFCFNAKVYLTKFGKFILIAKFFKVLFLRFELFLNAKIGRYSQSLAKKKEIKSLYLLHLKIFIFD